MGRNNSLNDIGYALGKINPKYMLEVYSGSKDPSEYEVFKNNSNVYYGGTISYENVQKKMRNSDVTVIVEGFRPKDIDESRYSLSTKAADALASGATILTYGSQECGIVEYMQSTKASYVCTDKKKLEGVIREMISTPEKQQEYYNQQIVMTLEHHNVKKSCELFMRVIDRAMNK